MPLAAPVPPMASPSGPAVLATLGAALALGGVAAAGGLPYGLGTTGAAYAVHLGLCWLLTAGAVAVVGRAVAETDPAGRALRAAPLALGVLWVVAVALAHVELTTPPRHPATVPLARLVPNRLAFVLALAPAALGYPLGTGADRRPVVGGGAVAVLGAVGVARLTGPPTRVTALLYLGLGTASALAGAVAYAVGRVSG